MKRARQQTYVDARKARGDAKVTFWLTPERAQVLDALAGHKGSRQKAIDWLLDSVELAR